MKTLDTVTFLIHAFCWTCRRWGPADEPQKPYLEREQACAEGWRSRLKGFSERDALAVIPGSRKGAAGDFYALAADALGDRLFMLDSPDCLEPAFWTEGSDRYRLGLLSELEAAFVRQRLQWNQEELHTALHCRACCRQFDDLLAQRGYALNPATLTAEAWGASFDGCVTKYTLNLRQLLGLSGPIGIPFDLTVPDAAFLLNASLRDTLLPDSGLRLFLFEFGGRFAGLYTFTAHSLADPPARVTLPVAPESVEVWSKQGLRLWPRPEPYILPAPPPLGCHEPPQAVVTHDEGGLRVPVNAGMVYRLAKAPAYVVMPRGTPYAEARAILMSANLA